MKIIITISLLLINYSILISCSCSSTSFCSIMNNVEETVVFKGETLKLKDHNNGFHSAVIKVLLKIKGEAILTDTIELFGGDNQAGCEVNLHLNIGDINFFAMIITGISTIDINQFEFENDLFWVSDTNSCWFKKLNIERNFVTGPISDKFDRYPLELFERDLVECSFSVEDLQKYLCPDFKVFPNPVKNNIFLSNTDNSRLIDELKIYSTTGELLLVANSNQILNRNIPLPNLDERLVILEITCGEERILQKLIILQ